MRSSALQDGGNTVIYFNGAPAGVSNTQGVRPIRRATDGSRVLERVPPKSTPVRAPLQGS